MIFFLFLFSPRLSSEFPHLVFASMLNDLLVHNVVHELEPLHRLLLCYADELLLQGHGAETVVEEKQPFFGSTRRNVATSS